MNFKKIISLLVSVVMICAAFSMAVSCIQTPKNAERGQMIDITLRIVGKSDTLYYSTLAIPYDTELTIQDVLIYADEISEKITLSGADAGYITAVNGETAGTYGGYDGWLVRLNGADISYGIGDVAVSNGDSIVLYYGDPFGVGMQFPEFSYKNGTLTVTSKDTIYDNNFTPSTVVNPVANADVVIDGANYKTDENGQIALSLSEGNHSVDISKYAQNGCPLVLRPASDFKIVVTSEMIGTTTVEETTAPVTTAVTEDAEVTGTDTGFDTADTGSDSGSDTTDPADTTYAVSGDIPATGDMTVLFIALLMLSVAVFTLVTRSSKIKQQ